MSGFGEEQTGACDTCGEGISGDHFRGHTGGMRDLFLYAAQPCGGGKRVGLGHGPQ